MTNETIDPVSPEIASSETQVLSDSAPDSSSGNRVTPKNSGTPDAMPFQPDLQRLGSALKYLPAKSDDKTFKFYRIAPMAREARLNPEMANDLYKLAKKWSGGGSYFERLWDYFINQRGYSGQETTLGTVYRHAKDAGWVFKPVEAPEQDAEQ